MKIESPIKSLRNLTANPLKTRDIEVSRIKYDKLDASILADVV